MAVFDKFDDKTDIDLPAELSGKVGGGVDFARFSSCTPVP